MRGNRRNFYLGFAAAVAAVARDHGKPAMAVDIMEMQGVRLKDFVDAGVVEFDLRPLRDEWKTKHRSQARR